MDVSCESGLAEGREIVDATTRYVLLTEFDLPEWQGGRTKAYADVASIEKRANITLMTILLSHSIKHATSEGFVLSMEQDFEFACEEKLFRFLRIKTYSEDMAKGRRVYEVDVEKPQWREPKPPNPAAIFFKFACEHSNQANQGQRQ